MKAPLSQSLKLLWDADLPFVCYKLPNTKKAVVYHQKDTQINFANQLESEGFIMAPFDLSNQIICIPNLNIENFNLEPFAETLTTDKKIKYSPIQRNNFKDLIGLAKKGIANGDLRKVIVSQRQKLHTKRNLVALFYDLLHIYPEAMVYLWHHPKVGTWFGASPEQFIISQGAYAHTMALAATQHRQKEKAPQWKFKEIEEQELVRIQIETDLNKFFSPNQILKSPTTNFYTANLVHLSTVFKFPNKRDSLLELAKALHPTPAVGGMPKEKAIAFISENEGYDREFYTGFFGPVSREDYQLFVNLRCAQWTKEAVFLYSGAGITSSSDPTLEWVEILKKMKTLAAVL